MGDSGRDEKELEKVAGEVTEIPDSSKIAAVIRKNRFILMIINLLLSTRSD